MRCVVRHHIACDVVGCTSELLQQLVPEKEVYVINRQHAKEFQFTAVRSVANNK